MSKSNLELTYRKLVASGVYSRGDILCRHIRGAMYTVVSYTKYRTHVFGASVYNGNVVLTGTSSRKTTIEVWEINNRASSLNNL